MLPNTITSKVQNSPFDFSPIFFYKGDLPVCPHWRNYTTFTQGKQSALLRPLPVGFTVALPQRPRSLPKNKMERCAMGLEDPEQLFPDPLPDPPGVFCRVILISGKPGHYLADFPVDDFSSFRRRGTGRHIHRQPPSPARMPASAHGGPRARTGYA